MKLVVSDVKTKRLLLRIPRHSGIAERGCQVMGPMTVNLSAAKTAAARRADALLDSPRHEEHGFRACNRESHVRLAAGSTQDDLGRGLTHG